MASVALTDAVILGGAYDLRTFSNSVTLTSERMELDSTTFASGGYKERKGGLNTTAAQVAGFMSSGSDGATPSSYGSEDAVAALFASPTAPWTFAISNTEGTVAYFTKGLLKSYGFPQQHGELAAFNMDVSGNERLVRGYMAHPVNTDRTATGNTTGFQVGAVTSGQTLYAALHVVGVFGTTPSLTVKIQRDDNADFSSATDILTFTAATDVTSEWKTSTTASADSYYRVAYTISGTSPHFFFGVALGIA